MVENFGSFLKHERELRGVPLEEIASVTKVHIRYLEALENNDFDRLPGEVFIKGYIRSYAKVIGLDSEEMVTAYDESIGRERKQELENAQLENEKIHLRKKSLFGYVLGGIGLLGVVVMGYLGVGSLIEKEENGSVEQLSSVDPTANGVKAETQPLPEIKENDIENNSSIIQESESKALQEDPPPSPVVESKIKIEVNKKKPVETESKLKVKPSSPKEAKKEKPDVLDPPAPKSPQPEVEKIKSAETDSNLQNEPNPPPDEKMEPSETTEKPAETQKPGAQQEKPVIIQYVAGGSGEGAGSNSEAQENGSKRLHLMLQAQGNSWFNVTVDDGGEDDFILPGGSSKNIYGDEKFRVTIGNRRGTRIFLNGQSIDLPFGTNDVIRDFEITAKLIE